MERLVGWLDDWWNGLTPLRQSLLVMNFYILAIAILLVT